MASSFWSDAKAVLVCFSNFTTRFLKAFAIGRILDSNVGNLTINYVYESYLFIKMATTSTGNNGQNEVENAPDFQGNGPELTKKSCCIAQMLHLTLGLVGKLKKSITKQTFPLHSFV